jgi:hypothetical protein
MKKIILIIILLNGVHLLKAQEVMSSVKIPDGHYNIINAKSGMAMELYKEDPDDSPIIIQSTQNAEDSQKWFIQFVGKNKYYKTHHYIISPFSSDQSFLAIDIEGFEDISTPEIWEKKKKLNQEWIIQRMRTKTTDSVYYFSPVHTSFKIMELDSARNTFLVKTQNWDTFQFKDHHLWYILKAE